MIVFDASTLILLAKAELLETLLANVRQQVVIPKEVERECSGAKRSLDALLIQKAINEERIRCLLVRNKKLCAEIQRDFPVGRGEAEALSLAVEEKADIVAIDDRHGINACKLLRLPFVTAISLLVAMVAKGWLGKEEALRKLEALQAYGRYRAEIVNDARLQLEGKK